MGRRPPPVPGFVWVAQWTLQRTDHTSSSTTPNRSFEEIALDKIKGPQAKHKAVKRKKIDREAKVITNDEYLESLKAMEEEEELARAIEEDTEDELLNDEDALKEEKLQSFWRSITLPVPEEEVIHRWYVVIYKGKKRTYLHIGKAVSRFLEDENGKVHSLMIDCCMKQPVGSTDILECLPENQPADISPFPLSDIIAKVTVEPLEVRRLNNYWFCQVTSIITIS